MNCSQCKSNGFKVVIGKKKDIEVAEYEVLTVVEEHIGHSEPSGYSQLEKEELQT